MKILQVMNSLQFFVFQGSHPLNERKAYTPRTTRTLWSWILEYRNPTTSLHFADCHLESNLQSPGPAGSLQWKPQKRSQRFAKKTSVRTALGIFKRG